MTTAVHKTDGNRPVSRLTWHEIRGAARHTQDGSRPHVLQRNLAIGDGFVLVTRRGLTRSEERAGLQAIRDPWDARGCLFYLRRVFHRLSSPVSSGLGKERGGREGYPPGGGGEGREGIHVGWGESEVGGILWVGEGERSGEGGEKGGQRRDPAGWGGREVWRRLGEG